MGSNPSPAKRAMSNTRDRATHTKKMICDTFPVARWIDRTAPTHPPNAILTRDVPNSAREELAVLYPNLSYFTPHVGPL